MAAPVELTARSWVYTNGWAAKCCLDAINYEVFCKFPGCKKMYKSVKGSTGNIAEHLRTTHKLTKKHVNDGKLKNPITEAFTQGRPPITRDDFIIALIKFVISNKLPMSLVEDPSFQSLLNIAHSAHTDDIVKLPKKDSFKSRIQDQHQ
ncbi:hypothetical protein BG005_004669, partial [Podila minutissima]